MISESRQKFERTFGIGSLRGAGAFLVTAAIGYALWALSPAITGGREPFDAPAYYCFGLITAGMIAAMVWASADAILVAFAGVWAGQVVATMTLSTWCQTGRCSP